MMKVLSQFFSLVFIFRTVGAQTLGESCLRDKDCYGGYCSGSFWNRACVECEEDSHCSSSSFSPAGEAPAAFCVDDKCSKWKRGKPLGPEGYALNIDSKVWVPRKVLDKPTGLEMIRFLVDNEPNAGITVTDTHVSIPMSSHLQGEYASENYGTEVQESGIVNLFIGRNPVSVVLDNPSVCAGLKFHALKVEGKTNTKSADRVRKEVKNRSMITNAIASKERFQRDNLVAVATKVTNAGKKLVECAQDIDHMDQIRAFTKLENGKKGVEELVASSDYSRLRNEAKDAKVLSKTNTSKKAMNHCKHWDDQSGITFTETHAVFPLSTNLFTAAGQTEFSPSRWFGIAAGHTVFHYNKEDKALELYQVFTEQSLVNMDSDIDPTGLTPATFWVGPADGKDMEVSAVDGRTDEYYDDSPMSVGVKGALAVIAGIPADYNRLYADPDKQCTAEMKSVFQSSLEETKIDEEDPDFGANVWKDYHLIDATTDSIDCGGNYLRSPLYKTNALDILEYAVWTHLIIETEIKNAAKTSLDSRYWDNDVKLEVVTDEDIERKEVSLTRVWNNLSPLKRIIVH